MRLRIVARGGGSPFRLPDVAPAPLTPTVAESTMAVKVPRCNSFNMHTLGAPSQPPSQGGLCRGDAPGDPAPAALRRSQNG